MADPSQGLWWDPGRPDEQYAGALHVTEREQLVLELFGAPPSLWGLGDAVGQGSSPRVPMLHGFDAVRGEMTLVSLRSSGMRFGALGPGTSSLAAWWGVDRVHLSEPNDARFRCVEVRWPQVGWLMPGQGVELEGRLNRRSAKRVRFRTDDRSWAWDDGSVQITIARQTEIRIRSGVEASIESEPQVTFSSAAPLGAETWIDEWLAPLNDLFELLTGGPCNPRTITLHRFRRPTRRQRLEAHRLLGVGVGADHDFSPKKYVRPLLDLDQVSQHPAGLHGVLADSRRLTESHEVFSELLVGTIHDPKRPAHSRYMDLLGALEAYDTQLHGLGPVETSEFRRRRSTALEALRVAEIPAEDARFIQSWLPRRASYSLGQRVARIAGRDLAESWPVSAEQMARIRNDIAHGNTSPRAMADLSQALDQAMHLVNLVALRELGLADPLHPLEGGRPT